MKLEKTDGNGSNSSLCDVLIEFVKSSKELAIHVWDSESTPLTGKANFIVLFIFCMTIAIMMLMEKNVPKPAYIFAVIGIMSCMMSSSILTKFIERELER